MKFSEIEKEIKKTNNFFIRCGSFGPTCVYCNRCKTFIGLLGNIKELKCPKCDKERIL